MENQKSPKTKSDWQTDDSPGKVEYWNVERKRWELKSNRNPDGNNIKQKTIDLVIQDGETIASVYKRDYPERSIVPANVPIAVSIRHYVEMPKEFKGDKRRAALYAYYYPVHIDITKVQKQMLGELTGLVWESETQIMLCSLQIRWGRKSYDKISIFPVWDAVDDGYTSEPIPGVDNENQIIPDNINTPIADEAATYIKEDTHG